MDAFCIEIRVLIIIFYGIYMSIGHLSAFKSRCCCLDGWRASDDIFWFVLVCAGRKCRVMRSKFGPSFVKIFELKIGKTKGFLSIGVCRVFFFRKMRIGLLVLFWSLVRVIFAFVSPSRSFYNNKIFCTAAAAEGEFIVLHILLLRVYNIIW